MVIGDPTTYHGRDQLMLRRIFSSRTRYRNAMAEALRLIEAWNADRKEAVQ